MRFVFAILICLVHWDTAYFVGGYIGVPFFFIVSGFFLVQAVESVQNSQNVDAYCGSLIHLKRRMCKLSDLSESVCSDLFYKTRTKNRGRYLFRTALYLCLMIVYSFFTEKLVRMALPYTRRKLISLLN